MRLLTRMMANNLQENYSDGNSKSSVTLTLGYGYVMEFEAARTDMSCAVGGFV